MAQYANRTCTSCGIRKPQPEMYQRETYQEVGKSKQGISAATVVGSVIFNNKKSDKALSTWLFNSGQRTYKRKRTVWMCGPCAGVKPKQVSKTVTPKKVEKPVVVRTPNDGLKVGSAFVELVRSILGGVWKLFKWVAVFMVITAFIAVIQEENSDQKPQETIEQTN